MPQSFPRLPRKRPFRVGRSRTGLGLFAIAADKEAHGHRRVQGPKARQPKRPSGWKRAATAISTKSTAAGPSTARPAGISAATPIIPAGRMPNRTRSGTGCSCAQSRTSSRATRSPGTTGATTTSTSSRAAAASAKSAARTRREARRARERTKARAASRRRKRRSPWIVGWVEPLRDPTRATLRWVALRSTQPTPRIIRPTHRAP